MIEQSVSLASNGVVKVPGYEQLVRFGYTKNRGDKVKAGDLLAEVDVAAVRAEGYKTTTPIIVTNSDDYLDVFAAAESGSIRHGDKLLTVIKKG